MKKIVIIGHVDHGKTTLTTTMGSVLDEIREPTYFKPSPVDEMPNLIMYEKTKSKFHK